MENTYTMKTRNKSKWKFLLILLLAGWMGAYAQEEATLASWDPNIPSHTTGSYTLDHNVTVTNTITVEEGNTLTIYIPSGGGGHTIWKGAMGAIKPMFHVKPGGKLVIKGRMDGTDKKVITLNGKITYNTEDDARSGINNNVDNNGQGCAIYAEGALELEYVAIKDFWNAGNASGGAFNDGKGAAILSRNTTNTQKTIKLTHVSILGCGSRMGPAFCAWSNDYHNCTFTDVKIYHCWSKGGTISDGTIIADGIIRTTGGARTTMTLSECNIYENKSTGPSGSGRGGGGGITWENYSQLTITKGTLIHDNTAQGGGGGIGVEGKISITGDADHITKIYNNTCGVDGGGINLGTYTGGAGGFDGLGASLTIGSNVEIYNNTASGKGGGIYMVIQPSDDIGFNENNTPIEANFTLTINGGKIYNNKANKGAGIEVMDVAALKHYNKSLGKWSKEYKRNVNIQDGYIYNNTTIGSSGQHGAGITIYKGSNDHIGTTSNGSFGYTYSSAGGAGTLNVNVSGGNINNNKSDGGNGGGVYIEDNMGYNVAPYYSFCNVNISGSYVYNNTCGGNGAGFYIDNGSVTINGGSIGRKRDNPVQAPNVANERGGGFYIKGGNVFIVNGNGTPIIADNQATWGGGLYVTSDSYVWVYGGNIRYNQAKKKTDGSGGNGGGIYSNSEVDFHDGIIHGNTAEAYGGGLFIPNDGTATMTFSGGTFSENQASLNGGGMCIGGGSVTVSGGDIYGNKAANGNGGGILTASRIVVDGGNIYNNTAEYNGGGIYADGDASLNYTSSIYNNKAINGSGGGLYVTSNGGLTYSGTATVSNNTANQNGGGIYAEGNVNFGGGSVTDNVATNGSGGGAYIANGNDVSFANVEFFRNTALNGNGGAVCVNSSSTNNNVTINGAKIGEYVGTPYTITSDDFEDGTSGHYTTGGAGSGTWVVSESCTGNSTYSAFQGKSLFYRGVVGSAMTTDPVEFDGSPAKLTFSYCIGDYPGGIMVKYRASDSETFQDLQGFTASGGWHTVTVDLPELSGQYYFEFYCQPVGGSAAPHVYGLDNIVFEGSTPGSFSNIAINGGGVYVDSRGTVNIQNADTEISYNQATGDGGGIYLKSDLTYSGGTIGHNTAANDGGGIYVDEGTTLNLQGAAKLTRNHVPATGKGGGIFQNGTLNLGGGNNPSVKADDNYAGERFSLATQNNIYLPSASKVVTVVSDIAGTSTHVGISVEEGHCPVAMVTRPTEEQVGWLDHLMEGITTINGEVFDDAHYYVAVHTRKNIGPFDKQNIYFWTSWSHAVGTDPEGRESGYPLPEGYTNHYTVDDDGTWHIYTKEGLAWFASYVNGLNGNSPTLNRGTNAVLESDVNMIEHLWVPIGAVTAYDTDDSSYDEDDDVHYTGSFNGQGHVVDSILNGFLTGISRFGLFGSVGGNGTVKNTFLDGYTSIATNSSGVYNMGGISGCLSGGTISCSEARGEVDATMSNANTCVGGIVGSMGSSTVHSCMAMPDIETESGRVGGVAGLMESGASIKNSFANGKYTVDNGAGGLAGVVRSGAVVENCYSRIQGAEPDNFKWFARSNSGSIRYCYAPADKTNYGPGNLSGHGNYGATALDNGKYGFAHSDQQITGGSDSYVVNGSIGADGELTGLLATLNKWVGNSTTYARWTRTLGSAINDDYPVLQLGAKNDDEDFVCVGSKDGIFMKYNSDLDPMISAYNATDGGGNIYLYATPGMVAENTDADVKVSIAPNIGIQQAVTADGTSANTLNARVGVVLDNSDGSIEMGGAPYDWHMFSSAIQDVPMGLEYDYEGSTLWETLVTEGFQSQGVPDEWYHNPVFMDPPKTTWSTENIGYFPTNTPYGTWRGTADPVGSFDFYCYSEPFCHWVNFKRFGKEEAFFDHWHQDKDADGFHANIEYTNEENMVEGKGYLVAVSQPSMLMADGVLNNGNLDVPVTATGYDESLVGVNLIGNPYQSYLDFDAFAAANIEAVNTYYILDADKKGYIAHVMGSSTPLTGGNEQNNNVDGHVVASLANEQYGNDGNTYNFADVVGIVDLTAPRYIHPHQGFIVCVDANASVRFGNEMRVTGEALSTFRGGGENHYPMISVICTDDDGLRDYTTMELGRPEAGGGKKVQGLRTGDGSVWFRIDDTDWQTAFTKPGLTEATLCFKAYADGVYTLRWQPANAQFSYLHLIDHITGRDIDCLTTGQYVFEGHASDYKSRFKLVFGYEGGEAPAEPEPVEGQESFAFQMGDHLIVNGEGTLQLFDVSGRCLLEEGMAGSQSAVSLPKAATGVYVLRLIGSDKVKTQKIVISKL